MKWLALDTSSAALSLALGQGSLGNILPVASFHQQLSQQHGASLLPQIQRLLQSVDWQVEDVAGLIVGVGPGSYTGLRIGVSLAKMWGLSRQIPVYQVSSLALLAQQAQAQPDDLILPIVDARRLSAYCNLFAQAEGELTALGQDGHVDWQSFIPELMGSLSAMSYGDLILIGHQIEAFADLLHQEYPQLSFKLQSSAEYYPRADLAFTGIKIDPVKDIHTLNPNYVHATLAERQWADQHQRPVANEEENERYIEHFS